MPDPDRLLSMKEAATLTPVSRATLYREMEAGRLAYVMIRSRRFVWQSELDRFLKALDQRRAA